MALKALIQQATQFDLDGQTQIHYAGSNPQTLTKVVGQLPVARQWPTYGNYIDVTNYVSDLQDLSMTWTQQVDSFGVSTPGENQQRKTSTGNLTFEDYGYQLIRKWLVDDISAPQNTVLVKIVDESCGNYEDWIIRPQDLNWCEDDLCTFDVNLKQRDEQYACIKSTLIWDNWQGWFQSEPRDGKKHPRFSYCNEQRPNGTMIMLWWLHAISTAPIQLIFLLLLPLINSIIFIINVIIGVINFIIDIVGGNQIGNGGFNAIGYLDEEVLNSAAQFYVESAGCGREYPAPLIRDYISNVCWKCGITVDETTAPLFFASAMEYQTSSRGNFEQSNPYFNACYLNAEMVRGVRRFQIINPFNSDKDETTFWIEGNRPLLTGSEFLDDLKPLFNIEWRLKDNKLYIQRKDYWKGSDVLYDFRKNGADRNKVISGVCFEFNDKRSPAYTYGVYALDATDKPGNEARSQMNDYVSHGNTDLNPNFDGHRDIITKFGATGFRLTGIQNDYIFDAMQVVVNSSLLVPFIAGMFRDFVYPYIREYADYALLLQDETTVSPKILLWDGQSYLNAKCQRSQGYVSINGHAPTPNPAYNPNLLPWEERTVYGAPKTFTKGSSLQIGSFPYGFYTVRAYAGILIAQQEALLVNYPMYFAPKFYDGLWDLFHWIDDPVRNPTKSMTWSVKIPLCCEDVERLGILNNAADIQLGERVLLDETFYPEGQLTEITVNNNTEDRNGQHIQLKGNS